MAASFKDHLPPALIERLKSAARRGRVTLFVVLLSALKLALHVTTGRAEIAVGFPHANRARRAFEGIVGYLVNPLMLRTEIGLDREVASMVPRVARGLAEVLAWHEVPFEWLLAELRPDWAMTTEMPFTAWFNFQNPVDKLLDLPGVVASRERYSFDLPRPAFHDLSVGAMLRPEGGMDVTWSYRPERYRQAEVLAIADRWRGLLMHYAEEEQVSIEAPLAAMTS